MRRAAAWLLLGALAPMLQGALARFLPAPWCPDLGLVLVVAFGLLGRNPVGGLLLASFVGFAADLLSGSLLGQHALLRIFAFAAARSASAQVNLVGAASRATFVALLAAADGLAMGGLTAFFSPEAHLAWLGGRAIALRAFVTGLAAPACIRLVERLLGRIDGDESGRRVLRLEPRGWLA